MSSPIIAIVTGANRGIGNAICQSLTRDFKGPLCLYATSRKGEDLGFKPTSPETQIEYPKLDIADTRSIQDLAKTIKTEHDGLDVLINNAGLNLDDQYSPENVKTTLDTNYRGTLKTFGALLHPHGRIVNVSSTGSSLSNYSPELQSRFRDPQMTLADLEEMMDEYQSAVDSGTERQKGWPKQAYAASKAAMNAMTATLARENKGLVINSCCPGWVATDMGKMISPTPPKDPLEGARIPIRLGFGDIGGVTGRYWGNDSISGKGDGQVQDW
ncbi:MAG: hypothetical protein Q9191_003630 [Dirinaria sp. TL-2023a]